MPSLSRFRKRAVEIARGVEENSALVVEGVALRVVGTLARTTPVDTGLARGNWVVSVGSAPDLSPRPPRSAGEVLDEARTRLRSVRADATVTVANGGQKVPYITRLNAGSSRQAPAEFVQNAAAAGLAAAAEARILRPRGGRGRRVT